MFTHKIVRITILLFGFMLVTCIPFTESGEKNGSVYAPLLLEIEANRSSCLQVVIKQRFDTLSPIRERNRSA
mgnify:CR=1 FL=1